MMKINQFDRFLFNGTVGDDEIPAYLTNTVEIVFNAVIGFNADDQIIFWNPAAEKMYGWSAPEAYGKTFAELCGSALASVNQEKIRKSLSGREEGETIKGECKFRRKNGSTVLVEYTARGVFDKDSVFSGYVSVYRDITERNQTLEEIRRLNAELQTQLDEKNSLLEVLPIGIWIGNQDCSVITGNSSAYRIMGLPPGINVSLSNPDLEMPLDLRIFVNGVEIKPENAPMQTVARTGKPMYNFEHQFLFADQTIKTFYASIVPIFDQRGSVRKVIAAYADFTERKQAEEQIRLAREYAEQTADRLARLQKVTAALSVSLTPAEVADVVVNQGISALGAVSGTMMLLTEDGQSLEMVQSAAPEDIVRPYKQFPISMNVPAATAIRTRHPVWLESRQEYLERYPLLAEQINAWGKQAAVAIPLVVDGRILGVMTMSFEEVLPQTPENLGFALTIAQQGAQALERARLYRQTQQALSELRMTYDQSPIGMVQLDKDLCYVRVNETFARMNGIPAKEHIGKHIREIRPDLAKKIENGFRKVIKTGMPVFNVEVVGETQAEPGVPHTWLESWYPMWEGDGKVAGLNVVIQDITNRKRDEHALAEFARQQESLFKLADKLHRTSAHRATFDAALDAILNALQCDRASILLFDDSDVMRFVAWRGLSASYRNATEGHSPWTADAKDPQPISFDDIPSADLDDELKAVIAGEGIGSLAFFPLVFDGGLIGKFMIYFNSPKTFSEKEVDLSLTIAHQLAYSIQRIRAEEALRKSEKQLQVLNESLERKVREQTAEVRKLASDLTKAEQRERHRISHILHEDLQQRMYAIQMLMEFMRNGFEGQNPAMQDNFDKIRQQLNEVVGIARHLSVDLSPPILRDEGLTQAVGWLASQMEEKYGLQIEVRAEKTFAIPDEDLQMLLFRCVRELLFNVVKHADVKKAIVSLEHVKGDFRIEVRDDGKGFHVDRVYAGVKHKQEEQEQRSFGLPTLFHRLSLFGGQMDIQSAPGAGTRVVITVPLSPHPLDSHSSVKS